MLSLVQPLIEYEFMQRAMLGVVLVALSSPIVGVFLVLRRMSLAGDALAHAVFPGVAAGFLVSGLSLGAMSLGGLIAGIIVALLTGAISRTTVLKEDASLVSLYVIAVALGMVLLSLKGTSIDLMSILFGSVLGLDDQALLMLAGVGVLTLGFFLLFYRPLIMDAVDPIFMASFTRWGSIIHTAFLVIVMMNLIAGLQALGTLLAVGAMMLPAVTSMLWTRRLPVMVIFAVGFSIIANLLGLLLSYHANLPAGPAMILVSGSFYIASLVVSGIKPVIFRSA